MALVSVIMPAHNAEATISKSILSVLEQSLSDFELIVCDDGSSDSTNDIIRRYTEYDTRVKLITNLTPQGTANARNLCIKKSNSRFMTFLDSDDYWGHNKLATQVNFMIDYNIVMSHSDYQMFDDCGRNKKILPPETISFFDIIKKCDIGCLTVMLDTSRLDKVYFPNIPKEDYGLWVYLLKKGIVSRKSPGCHAYYRKQVNSMSGAKYKEIKKQWIVLKDVAGVPIFYRFYCLFIYSFNGFFKHIMK
ncbi:glycosyltransferase family 2 protein [Pectobacterium polaris]|uniref:glycosyltransferase family 2 protein n=1 Tax=Pectobacterium polaris TaxID=2042057 RepID=UPI00202DAB8C|nr:glycosyltransferase family A protein [Pectobacterium polaris]MCL6327002.1 glycosyltransferase family 2 protein [Pectobacterium polaris]